ncbi:hypothetical protein M5K25_015817 [Dendrobium thyrsiflorum]|uniref:Uncharacterized protein n=1 Tax=Dendrobium thyrsiflorum TaxID=117978 RepID=A0ABD0URX9_DENTH
MFIQPIKQTQIIYKFEFNNFDDQKIITQMYEWVGWMHRWGWMVNGVDSERQCGLWNEMWNLRTNRRLRALRLLTYKT